MQTQQIYDGITWHHINDVIIINNTSFDIILLLGSISNRIAVKIYVATFSRGKK